MKTRADAIKGEIRPEQIVEDMLWKLGTEKPECRAVISGVVSILRKRNIELLNEQKIAKIETKMSTGVKIRELRKLKGMSQKQLADSLGCKVQFISSVETGERPIPKKRLTQLATILGVEESALVTLQGDGEQMSELK